MLRQLKTAYRHFKRRYPYTLYALAPLLVGLGAWDKVLKDDIETFMIWLDLIFVSVFTVILIRSMRRDRKMYINRINQAQERRSRANDIRRSNIEHERAMKALSDKIRDNPKAIDQRNPPN